MEKEDSFDFGQDQYLVDLFKKRCFGKEDKEGKAEEEDELEKLLKEENEDDSAFFKREDIFFGDESLEENNLMSFCENFENEYRKNKEEEETLQGTEGIFSSLFNNEYLSDAVFICTPFGSEKSEKIYCHSLILSTRNTYFKKLFEQDHAKERDEKGRLVIKMDPKFICSEVFMILVSYLYNGLLKVSYSNILLVLSGSQYLLMKDEIEELLLHYFSFLFDETNVCVFYEESFYYDCLKLREQCLDFIEEHSEKVISSPSFNELPSVMIQEIIKSDFFSVNELKLFKSLIQWAKIQQEKHKDSNMEDFFKELLPFIRFGLINPNDLRDKIEPFYSPQFVPKEYIMNAYRQQCFGSSSSSSSSSSFYSMLRPRLIRKEFCWDSGKKSLNVLLDKDKKVVTTSYTATKSQTVIANEALSEGLFYWEIEIQMMESNSTAGRGGGGGLGLGFGGGFGGSANESLIQIGITAKNTVNVEGYLAYNPKGYALCVKDGRKCSNSREFPYLPTSEKKIEKGDVVGVLWNAIKGSLSFYVNGKDMGVAFDNIPEGDYYPGVTVYRPSDKLLLKTNIKPKKKTK